VSKDSQKVTGNWGISVSNKFVVLKLAKDLVDPVPLSVLGKVNIVVLNVFNSKMAAGWVGDFIPEDGLLINHGWVDDASDEFPNLVKGKGLQDGVEFDRDTSVDQESLEESGLDDVVAFNFFKGGWGGLVFGSGDDFLINLDINDLGWLINNLGFSGDWLNNDLLLGWGNLNINISSDNFSSVNKEGSVDFVQKEFVVDLVLLSVVESLTKDLTKGGGAWVFGRVSSIWIDWSLNPFLSIDPVQVVLNGDSTGSWADVVLDIIVVSGSGWVVPVVHSLGGVWVLGVVGVWISLGNDLDLWKNVSPEEVWVTEILLELWDPVESLEQRRLYISSEDGWVFLVKLTEQRNSQVLPEDGQLDELFIREKGHRDIIAIRVWVGGGRVVVAGRIGWIIQRRGEKMFLGKAPLLLQQKIFNGRPTVMGWFDQVHQVHAASCNTGNECQHDESLHNWRRK